MTCIVGGGVLAFQKKRKSVWTSRLCSVGILKVGKVSVWNKSGDWW